MIPGTFSSLISKRSTVVPTFIGNSSKNVVHNYGAGDSQHTITYHASTTTGDFMLLVAQMDNIDLMATPTNWNGPIFDKAQGNLCRLRLYWKFNTGDTTLYISGEGAPDHQTMSVLSFRGVNTVSPINVIDSTGKGYNSITTANSSPVNGITTTVDNCFVLFCVSHCYPTNSGIFSGWTNANIDSGTELLDISTTTQWDGGTGVWGGGKLLAGSTGDTTFTSSVSGAYGGVSTALALTPE